MSSKSGGVWNNNNTTTSDGFQQPKRRSNRSNRSNGQKADYGSKGAGATNTQRNPNP